jgi:hypothetical protein
MKRLLLIPVIMLIFGCTKYSQPSQPRLSGEWQIDLVEYFRIEIQSIPSFTYQVIFI